MFRMSQQPNLLFQLIFLELISPPSTVLKHDLLNCCDFPIGFIFFNFFGCSWSITKGNFSLCRNFSLCSSSWDILFPRNGEVSHLKQHLVLICSSLSPSHEAPCGKKSDCPSFIPILCVNHPYQKFTSLQGSQSRSMISQEISSPISSLFVILKNTVLFYLPALC